MCCGRKSWRRMSRPTCRSPVSRTICSPPSEERARRHRRTPTFRPPGGRYLAHGRLRGRMPTTTRAPKPQTTPLTSPRYLFPANADVLGQEARAGLEGCRDRLEQLLTIVGPRTLKDLLVPYDRLLLELSDLLGQTKFLFDVHPDAAVRATADKSYQEAERFATDLALNRPLYDAFVTLDVSQDDP